MSRRVLICGLILWGIATGTARFANSADPTKEDLLKTFHEEFLELTPGKGNFPAEFTMGDQAEASSQPTRVIKMSPFFVAKYEVPQNLWEAVMGQNPSRWKGKRNSVEMLSFEDALEFCRRVTKDMQAADLIDKDHEIRLPSEAEWEYAARAGTKTTYSFGDDAAKLGDFGWFNGNAKGNDPPVGAKKPNDWGLYDVHGYLWEWCHDSWHDNYAGAPSDASPWTTETSEPKHVLRGGSWKDEADALTSFRRRGESSQTKDDAIGLRCVLAKRRN